MRRYAPLCAFARRWERVMLIERLKSFFDDDTTLNQREIIIDRAIDHIEALRAENAILKDKLGSSLDALAELKKLWN